MLLKAQRSNDRKKNGVDSKSSSNNYKLINSLKKNRPSEGRSSSMSKKKKIRINTEYSDADVLNIINFSKNFKNTPLNGKRKDSCAIEIPQNANKHIVHSTKSNPKKNSYLRSLFKNENVNDKYETKQTKTSKASNVHPLLKFVSNKNRDRFQSPYQKQVSRIEQDYKNRKSTSKQKSEGKWCPELKLNKDQIKLKPAPFKSRKEEEENTTVKTIKKKTEDPPGVYFDNQDESEMSGDDYGLTDQEEQTFGDRFPHGFEKVKLLGRGGFSLVWLGRHIQKGKIFAIKQIITKNTHQTHIKEIWFGSIFFTLGGIPKPQFSASSGIKNLVRLYSYEINQTDTWIYYQKCGKSLGSSLYDIRSERVYGQQRLYKIHYKPLYTAMAQNPKVFYKIVLEICKSLALLSKNYVVHSDLKTQNVLVRYNQEKAFQITQVKLIDYGSSFQFKNISQFSMATPEYMPPQILNYIIHENEGEYEQELYEEVMNNYNNPSAVDMWSLGCVMLEIVVGIPLWMSLPLLVPNKTGISYLQKQGLFAVKGRLFPQIIAKQRGILGSLSKIIDTNNYSRITVSEGVKKLIIGMLELDFNQRVTPQEAIAVLQEQLI